MKVTEVPEQIVVCVALMLTLGMTVEFTVMVMELEVAVVGEAHVALLVNTHVRVSLFARALSV